MPVRPRATTKIHKLKLIIFEREILKKIYRPTLNLGLVNKEKKKNEEIESIFIRSNIQNRLKAKRLK